MKWKLNVLKLWDAAKAVLRRKFIALNVYTSKKEWSQINSLMIHLNKLEKEKQAKSKASKGKISAEMKENRTQENSRENRLKQKLVLWSYLDWSRKKITKIKNEKGGINTDL